MIVTRQNHIPVLWLVMVTIPWILFKFKIQVDGLNFFILNRLIENPVTLTLVLSLPTLLITIIPLGAYISFMSDRVWTRWGRRKPFLILNFAAQAIVLFCFPLAPNIWIFMALLFIIAIVGQLGTPFEALKLEIVPPNMRGRSGAIVQWINTVSNIVFWGVIVGRFDEVMPFMGQQISGVKLLFWAASFGLLIVVFNYFFGVHEVQPRSTITGEKFEFKKLWHALTIPQLRYLYVFIIAVAMINAGTGVFGQLLYINQWGYSLQEMGVNIAVGGIINLFIIPIMGIFADKGQGNRMKLWVICLLAVKILTLGSFLYYTVYLPDQRPSLFEIIFWGETGCIFGILAGMIYYPLVYDYIPRNIMGTYLAGAGILNNIFTFLTSVGVGAFLWVWASIFQPPAGEMVQVTLDRVMQRSQVEQLVRSSELLSPSGKPAAARDISVQPFYANGIVTDSGISYEIRFRDNDSEEKRKKRDKLKNDRDLLNAKIKEARKNGKPEKVLASLENKQAVANDQLSFLDSVLSSRADLWRAEVVRGLGDHVMKEGSEILSRAPVRAIVAELPATHKVQMQVLDKLNRRIQTENPGAIDIKMVRHDRAFALEIAAVVPDGSNPETIMQSLQEQVVKAAAEVTPGLIAQNAVLSPVVEQPALALDVALVENPVITFVSVITKVVNSVLSKFTELPALDQKIITLGRDVCKGDTISHARVSSLPNRNGLRMIVVSPGGTLGQSADWEQLALAKIRKESASLKLTVPKPVLDQAVKPIKYNYLAATLYTFILVFFGLMLVIYFIFKERAGVVKKWGQLEASDEKQQQDAPRDVAARTDEAASSSPVVTPAAAAQTYTPGYLWPKIAGTLVGFVIIAIGVYDVWPSLRLLTTGTKTQAVVESIVLKKDGQNDVFLANQGAVLEKIKTLGDAKDFSWTFYNRFAFDTKDGNEVSFERNVGCKLKPTMPLLDEYGLPTIAPVCYDPQNPQHAILPMEYSTWLTPLLVIFVGLILFLMSGLLALFALKPIVLSNTEAVNLE